MDIDKWDPPNSYKLPEYRAQISWLQWAWYGTVLEMGDPLHALNSVDTLNSGILQLKTQGKPETKDNFF